jgi:hypothetical protein
MTGKTMADIAKNLKDEDFIDPDEGEIEDGEDTPEPSENLNKDEPTTTGQPTDGETVTPPTETKPPEFDPIAYVDSLNLPDDQKKIMKEGYLRQADYTRKTQGISKIQSEYDEYVTRGKPILERIFADPKLLKQVLGITEETPASDTPEIPPEDPTEYAKWVKDSILKEIDSREQERYKRQTEESKQKEIWEARKADANAAEKVDPRLTSDEEFQKIVAGVVLQDTRYLNGEISAVQATKEAIQFLDKRIKTAETKAKTDLVNRAKQVKPLIGEDNSPREPVGGKPRNMREAFSNAQSKGLLE